jgi:hypothetical protein
MGADHLQGYLLSRPLTAEDLATLVERAVPGAVAVHEIEAADA